MFVALGLPALQVAGLVGLACALLLYQLVYHGLLLAVGRKMIRKRIRRTRHLATAGPTPG
jgi:hypothetical protein